MNLLRCGDILCSGAKTGTVREYVEKRLYSSTPLSRSEAK